jgi:hypothetical protein
VGRHRARRKTDDGRQPHTERLRPARPRGNGPPPAGRVGFAGPPKGAKRLDQLRGNPRGRLRRSVSAAVRARKKSVVVRLEAGVARAGRVRPGWRSWTRRQRVRDWLSCVSPGTEAGNGFGWDAWIEQDRYLESYQHGMCSPARFARGSTRHFPAGLRLRNSSHGR